MLSEDNESISTSTSKSYISNFVCTYQLNDDYSESFILYQTQILQVFDLQTFDDNVVNNITEKLYEQFKDNKYILAIIADSNMKEELSVWNMDNLTKFRFIFGYDTFHLIHNLLCSLINNTEVNETNYKKLINK